MARYDLVAALERLVADESTDPKVVVEAVAELRKLTSRPGRKKRANGQGVKAQVAAYYKHLGLDPPVDVVDDDGSGRSVRERVDDWCADDRVALDLAIRKVRAEFG